MQAAANSRFRTNLGGPSYAAFFSICGTFLTAALGMLAFWILFRPPTPSGETLCETQWWNWLGGPLGALIVLAGATLVRELGAGAFVALFVAGQIFCSMLMDHFSLMGLHPQPLTLGRAIGAMLVIAGVVCIKYL